MPILSSVRWRSSARPPKDTPTLPKRNALYDKPLDLFDIALANDDPEYGDIRGVRPGAPVTQPRESWLEARGRIARGDDGELFVADAVIKRIPEPEDPYVRG